MNFRIGQELESKIREHCNEKKITVSDFMREAAEEYLKPKQKTSRQEILLEKIFVMGYASATATLDSVGAKNYVEQAKKALAEIG